MNRLHVATRVALSVGVAIFSATSMVMAQAGSLDPTFGVGGIVTTGAGTECGFPINCAVAIQRNGKIVVAGLASEGNNETELALARYNTDGSLDASFGNTGIVVNTHAVFAPLGVAIQSDGKIVTAAPDAEFLRVFRFTAAGALDPSFGAGGIASTSAAGILVACPPGGVALVDGGRILVAVNHVLLRFLSNGQLDSGFGTAGVAPLLVAAQGLLALPSGKALVTSAFTFSAGSAARFNPNGSLDTAFGASGQVPGLGQALAIASVGNGSFVLAGCLSSAPPSGNTEPREFVLVRYNNNGTVDNTFGTRGAAVVVFPGNQTSVALALAVQSDGDIVAAGVTAPGNTVSGQQPSDFALARFTANGQLDTTFGTGGLVTTAFGPDGSDGAAASALAIQSDGKIVAVGNDSGNGFTLARYLAQ